MAEIQLQSRIKGRDASNFWRLGRKRRVHQSTIFRAVSRKLKEEMRSKNNCKELPRKESFTDG